MSESYYAFSFPFNESNASDLELYLAARYIAREAARFPSKSEAIVFALSIRGALGYGEDPDCLARIARIRAILRQRG